MLPCTRVHSDNKNPTSPTITSGFPRRTFPRRITHFPAVLITARERSCALREFAKRSRRLSFGARCRSRFLSIALAVFPRAFVLARLCAGWRTGARRLGGGWQLSPVLSGIQSRHVVVMVRDRPVLVPTNQPNTHAHQHTHTYSRACARQTPRPNGSHTWPPPPPAEIVSARARVCDEPNALSRPTGPTELLLTSPAHLLTIGLVASAIVAQPLRLTADAPPGRQ